MSQLVPVVELRRYACTVALVPRVHVPSLSRTRSGLVYQPRSFLAAAALPSHSHSESTMLSTDGDDPVPTSSTPQAVPPLISIPTTAVVSHTGTSDASVAVEVRTSAAPF